LRLASLDLGEGATNESFLGKFCNHLDLPNYGSFEGGKLVGGYPILAMASPPASSIRYLSRKGLDTGKPSHVALA